MTIKIYGMGPSRSFRALWAAEEAGINYEYIQVAFGSTEEGGTQHEAYKKLNRQGKVPAIVDDSVSDSVGNSLVLTESAAILNYFAKKSENKQLIPNDQSIDRAKYDEMCFFILSELEQGLWSKGKHSFALPEEYRVPEMLEKTIQFEFAKAQDALLYLKANKPFAIGDYFTMADVLLGQTLAWAHNFKFEVHEDLLAYKEKMFAREACVKAKNLIKLK